MQPYPGNQLPQYPYGQQPPLPPRRRSLWHWYRSRGGGAQITIGCGVLIGLLFIILLCPVAVSGFAQGWNASGATPTAASQAIVSTTTTTPTQASQPAVVPTNKPTSAPTAKPTAKPTPTPTPKPAPTAKPTPTPTPKPKCQAVNNNPWCYNFSPGNLIYVPPSGFCNYFNCIASFYAPDDPGDGFIIECTDGTYSQSGGESGACSHHGGELRPLYSH